MDQAGQHVTHYHFLKSELSELFTSISLREFARRLINIFVPIYLINLGYSFMTAFIFMAIISFAHVVSSYFAAKLSARIGFKHLIILSVPFLIIYYLLLNSINFVQSLGIPLVLIAIFGGISNGFFWIGYHTDFVKSTKRKDTGKKLGFVRILISLFQSLGPIVGAFLIAELSFHWVFIIVIAILIISVIPLLLRKDKHERFKFSLKDIKFKFGLKAIIAHMGKGIESSVYSLAWPIFIYFFILNKEITLLGSVTSLSLIFSLIITYVIAKKIDKKINLFYKVSAFVNAIIWIIRGYLRTYLGVFIVDAIYGISNTTHTISFNKICYDNARKSKSILEYITIREMIICGTHTVMFLLLGLIGNFHIMFLIGTIGALMYLPYRD